MTTIAFIVLGSVAALKLPVSLMPDIDIPEISIHYTRDDASASEIENTITGNLRSQLQQIPHLTSIQSESKDGSGQIKMKFEYGTSIDYAFIEANQKVDAAMNYLPQDMQRPIIIKASTSDIPVFYIHLYMPQAASESKFLEFCEFTEAVLKKRLEQLPDVAMVDISGNYQPEMYILPDAAKLRSLNITQEQLQNAINKNNQIAGSLSIRDGYYPGGRKILSFVNILQHDVFPLADTLDQLLRIGQKEMGRPVEIEFAVNISPEDHTKATFYLLQIRPIVDNKEVMEEDLSLVKDEETILSSKSVLGHGIVSDVRDVIYVKTGAFNSANDQAIAREIERMNRTFTGTDQGFVLVGPGRWGSSDPWLGIPVKWPHISNARVIVECGLENYRVDPSQGTHFFQNLTSFGVGYFTINPFKGDGWFDEAFLNAQPAVEETDYIRHVRFDAPITIKMDGKRSLGVVLKPA